MLKLSLQIALDLLLNVANCQVYPLLAFAGFNVTINL